MTAPDPTTTNVAGDNAHVGFQAGVVHGDINNYTTSEDAPAEKSFELGVDFLERGVPTRAWPLIDKAFVDGYRTSRTCFYWLLALVSGRARNELPDQETEMLENRRNLLPVTNGDDWADGVDVTHCLLDSGTEHEADTLAVFQELDKLGDIQRGLIVTHLEHFLDGPLRDEMWSRALTRAEEEQMARAREKRVWKFFQADPQKPRIRQTRPPDVSGMTWAHAFVSSAVFALAALDVAYLLARTGRFSALAVYALSVAAGFLGVRNGVEWRFREVRRRAKDAEFETPRRGRSGARRDGFAKKVDNEFDRYFDRYVPDGVDRRVWRNATEGIRNSLRDEMVEVYRESRVGVEEITWLIRHQVSDIKMRWEDGTLWSHRTEFVTSTATRAMAVFGLVAAAVGGIWAVAGGISAGPQSAAIATAVMLASGWLAARTWLHIVLEGRRYAAEDAERDRVRRRSWEAYDRWRAKLADKPQDQEMAAWLDCDRKVLLSGALRHYRLSMSDVLAYAFIEAQADRSAKRARLVRGPWRYLRYRLRVFLLTRDGVRQLEVELDFARGAFQGEERANFRYESVSVVRVRQGGGDARTFELALVDGGKIEAQVIEPGMEELQPGENPGEVAEVTLDAAGLSHTLHVLEGIAAEGKPWIKRMNRRGWWPE